MDIDEFLIPLEVSRPRFESESVLTCAAVPDLDPASPSKARRLVSRRAYTVHDGRQFFGLMENLV